MTPETLNINSVWFNQLQSEFEKPYFEKLWSEVADAYDLTTCFPPKRLIFEAFNYCEWDHLKVVIVGQDPYHGLGEAHGLSFSVPDGTRIPPSLRNIFKELNEDLGTDLPIFGSLERWAKQGVLLLNAGLTVEKDKANSHKHLNWSVFTNAVIEHINQEKEGVVFLLWGNFAQKKGAKIDLEKHLVLTSGHPSPMSANQGKWFGNKHFSLTNKYLRKAKKKAIKW
ncbi:uracil-DNA glycosylase [Flavobacterium tegetincola]|uniref:uracil-DNA glycosylase n=1 Tax=Flavobacterium tegetincola TaxID=150172 RepID=UPI00041363DC|nr:uracil-DNA glycosylase [Flavobacterium tegetincola]